MKKKDPTFWNSCQYQSNLGMALLYQGIHITMILSLSVIEVQTLLQSRKAAISRNLHSTDNINLPTYMCRRTTANITHICDRMKAIRRTKPSFCNCYCPNKKSTFYERDWTCKDNRKIRKAEGTMNTSYYVEGMIGNRECAVKGNFIVRLKCCFGGCITSWCLSLNIMLIIRVADMSRKRRRVIKSVLFTS